MQGYRPDAALAAALTVTGLLEVLLDPANGSRAVSAVAVVATTVPLAWRRIVPLLPLAAIAVALIVQAALDGFLIGHTATPVVALVVALYSAGRYVESDLGLVAAALGVLVTSGTRVAADPGADSVGHAVLTVVAVSLPLLAGRWVRGQTLLQRRLAARAARLERDRERDARAAAEEERMRIAGDLNAAIAGRLREIARAAETMRLDSGELNRIAAVAREALADVRRVLGILRRDGEAPPLTPPERPGTAAAPQAEMPGAGDTLPTRRAAPDARMLDRLLAAAVLVGAEVELAFVADDPAIAALTAVPIALPLLWRRRAPLPTAAAVFAAIALQSALLDLDAFPISDIGAVVVATYSIAAHAPRRTAVMGLIGALAAAAVHAAVFYPDGVVAALLGGVAAPWVGGRVVRGHRELTQQSREDAAAAENARRQEARAAVTAERMRVARELHDAVAHNISVIAIQAGGADGIVERDPERAQQIVTLIGNVAREALAELGRLVGTIDTAPPSLAGVDTLAARAREAGQPVELEIEGAPAELPRGVDLAAYRIVQEALANASKHAAGARARVTVRYEPRAVDIEVADDGGKAVARGNGHGLVGIRERVALYGGTLDAGTRPGGGFRVHARLPIA